MKKGLPTSFVAILAVVMVFYFFGFNLFQMGMSPREEENDRILAETVEPFTLSSPVFANFGAIPSAYTCEGDRTKNPPLQIAGVPEGAASLVLVMDDPDVPKELRPSGVFDHWVLYNIPPQTRLIGEGEAPGILGKNGAGNPSYTGPCPPAEYEPSTHRYVFTLFALDTSLTLLPGATKEQVLDTISGHVIGSTQLVGLYKKTGAQVSN